MNLIITGRNVSLNKLMQRSL